MLPEHSSTKWHHFILKNPSRVTKTDISLALGVSGTCKYPFTKLSSLMYLAWPILSIQSLTLEIGKESVFVTKFTLQKSVQEWYVPSFFGTRIQGELHSLWLCSMFPCCNMHSICFLRNCSLMGFRWYGCYLIGTTSPTSASWNTHSVLAGTS